MVFNIEYGAENYSVDEVVDIISRFDADIICICESTTNAKFNVSHLIAKQLDYYFAYFAHNDTTVLSKFKLYEIDPIGIVRVELDEQDLYFVSVHLSDFPYQPSQIYDLEYCAEVNYCQRSYSDERMLIKQANLARGSAVDELLHTLQKFKDHAIVICGDFNEPSHLDWSHKAAKIGLIPQSIKFPTSTKFSQAGFIDMYRTLHPDEIRVPGYTWPTTELEYKTVPDRIDFIYYYSDKIIPEWITTIDTPSDHYAVLGGITLLD